MPKPPSSTSTVLDRLLARAPRGAPAWVIGALGVGGALFLARWLDARQPLRSWLSLQLAAIWLWEAYLAAACAAVGYRLARRALPAGEWTPLETLAVGYPAGIVVFVLGVYVAGFLHLLRPALAIILPGLMLAAGAPPLVRAWRDARAPLRLTLGGLPLVATAVGLLLLGVLYLGALSPDAINYDASWNHLVIAQDYAREGRIIPFPGDWIRNLPHLGSVLNTWSFLVPGFHQPALRWMTALHTEFVVFVGTLVGVAAAARWFADREQPATWTAFALFPGIFAYDGNIGGSADHFLALFAAPLLLLTGKAWARLDRGTCVLWGVLAGGALMAKAQGVYLVAPFAVALVGRAAHLVGRRSRAAVGLAPPVARIATTAGLAAAAALAVMLPHLASNFVFFRNPVYPLLQNVFTASTPTVADAPTIVKYMVADWRYFPPEPLLEKLAAGAKAAFTFSFVPHYSWVNNLPVFGSTFTLSLPFVLMLREARRLWLGVLLAMGAVLTWALTYWVDRNLQGITPALIAITAAILVRAWQVGWYARVGVAALVLVQIVWAGNIYFQGADRISGAANLLGSTIGGHTDETLAKYRREFVALGRTLPADARLMLHDAHVTLGIDKPTVLDWVGFQGLFDYRLYKTPRDLYDRMRALGVTHVVWLPVSPTARSKQEELIFDAFVDAVGGNARRFGAMSVVALPPAPPPDVAPYQILVAGVGGYADGIYPIEALSTCEELPPSLQRYAAPSKISAPPANVWSLLDDANVVFLGRDALPDRPTVERLNRDFRQIRAYAAFRLYLRK